MFPIDSINIFYEQRIAHLLRRRKKDFLKQVKSEALQIHNFLKQKTGLDIFVKPILVFSGYASMSFGLRPIDGVYVIGKSFLHEFFDKDPVADFSRFKIEEALKEL